ncbi:hypothetical protein [Mycolicibacterium monacense]|uniref:Uncharacterized protein n=1 Tax=Mycolicibacterium monacense TaxID=85693 RepID=A0AAD1IUC6_MYCMB|nr:hypothetical protein [Mycolicibacterium monacense]MDA4100938.1 hypothetical protein [Mycolicibacterium monacense DSM 44395]ORB19715.1 hypothetical protein BST34_13895 [Mycolicibacterium monacense DSM 44395]QHP86334.1 hypothetical protein EWR22_13765 [Mycolicibacterium monacense DSM 44395]BBZ60648.1 hypothetical protein MMON_19490 [Mycolicibacterium monacense]
MSGRDRPAGIPASAHQLWDNGAQSEQVRAGDLWVLSWDREVVGLAAIAAAKHGFVLAWPVTLPGEVSFAPGLVVENSPLGVPVTLWPTRETGIGDHLLDRSLGQLLLPDRIRPISFALDDSDDPGLAFAPGSARDSDNTEADRLMVDHWTELCFNAGGAEEGSFLDSAKVRQAGGSSRIVSEVLGLALPELRALMDGIVPISDEQLTAVAERLGVNRDALVGADPLEDVVIDLASPSYKHLIAARTEATGLGEADIRRFARREFALAARNDSDALREAKLRDAINRAGRDVR